MTTRTDYTEEEWKNIKSAPLLAGMWVAMVANSGPIDSIKEILAISDNLADMIKIGSTNELIATLIDELRPKKGETVQLRDTIFVNVKTSEDWRKITIATLQQANLALAKATPDEIAEYKQFVLLTARRVAETGKEGGFLGIGGVQVSPPEMAAIQEIRTTLGMAN